MGTSIQRALALTIIMDIMLVLVGGYYLGTTDYNNELITYGNNLQNFNSNFTSQYGDVAPNTQTTILENTFGDNKFGIGMFYSILKGGVTGIQPCAGIDESNCPQIESKLYQGWWIAFGIINMFLLLEILFIAYTKKNS